MRQLLNLAVYDRENQLGQASDGNEKLLLYSLVRLLRPKWVVEIGVYHGHTTAWILRALTDNKFGRYVGVDSWEGPTMVEGVEGGPADAMKRLTDNGIATRARFVTSDSRDFLKGKPDAWADIIVVDGCHEYEVAVVDIREALRVASKLVFVHDANQIGVRKALLEIGGGAWIPGPEQSNVGGGRWSWIASPAAWQPTATDAEMTEHRAALAAYQEGFTNGTAESPG